ncbi:hypothetical protein Tco_0978571 [Tanacetum coccineum]|uniref:Uncharacterized protein n=1 Tax=Tanacetum coccineum TaxID=301880 RepID=A0ABQ5EN88_9ASTR
MVYDHTPPTIAVPHTFSSHEDQQIKSTAEEGSSAIARAHDVCPNRVVKRRLGLWWEIKKSIVKEGDASSLLVTSSSIVLVASDNGSSQGDQARFANASNC